MQHLWLDFKIAPDMICFCLLSWNVGTYTCVGVPCYRYPCLDNKGFAELLVARTQVHNKKIRASSTETALPASIKLLRYQPMPAISVILSLLKCLIC